ncbi:hypothetical protein GIB67_008875 [Kingdonia uniflora]|uniref:Uncharacterized protein n=1 Tax=Kingdonia uniflora TaxID=39325 RepID=A0A7J7LVI2_9MAGN|nr:hypothetical protein GIB67_008875 [Kingdonia uniflora]
MLKLLLTQKQQKVTHKKSSVAEGDRILVGKKHLGLSHSYVEESNPSVSSGQLGFGQILEGEIQSIPWMVKEKLRLVIVLNDPLSRQSPVCFVVRGMLTLEDAFLRGDNFKARCKELESGEQESIKASVDVAIVTAIANLKT